MTKDRSDRVMKHIEKKVRLGDRVIKYMEKKVRLGKQAKRRFARLLMVEVVAADIFCL